MCCGKRVPKPCLNCSEPTIKGSYCIECQRALDKVRNASPKRAAYKDPSYRSYPKGDHCVRCGTSANLTIDHIVPLSKGGTNDWSNLTTLCRSCNSSKGNREA